MRAYRYRLSGGDTRSLAVGASEQLSRAPAAAGRCCSASPSSPTLAGLNGDGAEQGRRPRAGQPCW